MAKRYSVACENDDIEDFDTKAQAMAYARQQRAKGRSQIVVNVTDTDGQYLDAIKV